MLALAKSSHYTVEFSPHLRPTTINNRQLFVCSAGDQVDALTKEPGPSESWNCCHLSWSEVHDFGPITITRYFFWSESKSRCTFIMGDCVIVKEIHIYWSGLVNMDWERGHASVFDLMNVFRHHRCLLFSQTSTHYQKELLSKMTRQRGTHMLVSDMGKHLVESCALFYLQF